MIADKGGVSYKFSLSKEACPPKLDEFQGISDGGGWVGSEGVIYDPKYFVADIGPE